MVPEILSALNTGGHLEFRPPAAAPGCPNQAPGHHVGQGTDPSGATAFNGTGRLAASSPPECVQATEGTMNSLYETLQVSPLASSPVIRAAYRCLAQQLHPDKHPDSAEGGHSLACVNQAYAVLSDPEKRQAYDLRQGVASAFVERRGRGAAGPGASAGSGRSGSRLFSFRPLV